MATPVFPDDVLVKIRAGKQASRFRAVLGNVYQFRAFCCNLDADTAIGGIAKTPICDLELTPNPVCLGNAVAFDMTGSYSPSDLITDYSIDMGDGNTYNISSGNHTYLAAGTYDVVGRVVENSGRYQTANAQVVVTDCSVPLLITYTYLATYGDGVWFMDWTAAVPTWEDRSTGLDGLGLNVNSLLLYASTKHLPDTSHELWAATDGGLYQSWNGGRSWAKAVLPDPSNAEFGDIPPATVGGLNFIKAVASKTDPNLMWVLACSAAPVRTWIYMTEDDGLSWSSRGLKVDP